MTPEECPLCDIDDQQALVQQVIDHYDEEAERMDWLAAKRSLMMETTITGLKTHLDQHIEVVMQDG